MEIMIRKSLIRLYTIIDKYQRLFPKGIKKELNINGILLAVNELDSGGMKYESQSHEVINRLYALIGEELKPEIILDIGANYGFISICISKQVTNAEVIAIEPVRKLIPYMETNLARNKVCNYQIINAVCGDASRQSSRFHINPVNSQDCRVTGRKGWKLQEVPMVSIDSILKNSTQTLFIKIDTQGYESSIIHGGMTFLTSNDKWLMKMEFTPYLLAHHGVDPGSFLSMLVDKFDVAELPAVIPYLTVSINELFRNKIKRHNINDIIKYVENLKLNNTGWVDLLIRRIH